MNKALAFFAAILAGFITGAFTSFAPHSDSAVNPSGAANRSKPLVQPKSTTARSVRKTEQTDDERFGKIASALQETSVLKQQHDLYEALAALDAASMREIVARGERLPARYSFFMRPLLDRWFALDEDAATAWVRAHPHHREGWLSWARNSPESALAEVHAHPQSALARETLRQSVWALVGKEKPAVAAKLAALESDFGRDSLLATAITDWAKEDPKAAFLFAKKLPDAQQMITLCDVPLRSWIERDPERAKGEVEALARDASNGSRALGLIADVSEALAKNDPVHALEWLNGLPENCRAPAPYLAIASTWAKSDAIAALEWCRANGVETGRGIISGGWFGSAVISEAIRSQPEETIRWIEATPDPATRDTLLEHALSARSKWTGPTANSGEEQQVLALMTTLPHDAQERIAYSLGGLRTTRKESLNAVREWFDRFSDPTVRSVAIEAFAENAFSNGTAQKEHLLAEFPDGAERDAVLRGMVAWQNKNSVARGAESAAETALQISDPQKCHDALDDFVIDWLHRDPRSARQWLSDPVRIPPQWSAAWLAEAERTR
jgi:hypothetical protein